MKSKEQLLRPAGRNELDNGWNARDSNSDSSVGRDSGEACRPEEGWQEEDAPGGAGELVELAARGEDDEPDLSIAEHGELEGLLEQPVAALGEGHLPARRVLYPLQLRLPPHHRGRPIPSRLPETEASEPNPGTLHEQAAPNANQPTNSSNCEVR